MNSPSPLLGIGTLGAGPVLVRTACCSIRMSACQHLVTFVGKYSGNEQKYAHGIAPTSAAVELRHASSRHAAWPVCGRWAQFDTVYS